MGEKEQHRKLAKYAPTKPLDEEGAAVTIQSSWKSSRQDGTSEVKKVNAHTVFENSVDANSSVPQALTHTGAEKEAVPKARAEQTNKKKKEGKDVAVQKAKAEGGAREEKREEKEAIPKGRAEKRNNKKKEGKDVAVQTAKAEEATISM